MRKGDWYPFRLNVRFPNCTATGGLLNYFSTFEIVIGDVRRDYAQIRDRLMDDRLAEEQNNFR